MKKRKTTAKTPRKTPRKKRRHPLFEKTYEEEVEFMCPVRGLVRQKVTISKYRSPDDRPQKPVVGTSDVLDKLEEQDDGLNLYDADEHPNSEPAESDDVQKNKS